MTDPDTGERAVDSKECETRCELGKMGLAGVVCSEFNSPRDKRTCNGSIAAAAGVCQILCAQLATDHPDPPPAASPDGRSAAVVPVPAAPRSTPGPRLAAIAAATPSSGAGAGTVESVEVRFRFDPSTDPDSIDAVHVLAQGVTEFEADPWSLRPDGTAAASVPGLRLPARLRAKVCERGGLCSEWSNERLYRDADLACYYDIDGDGFVSLRDVAHALDETKALMMTAAPCEPTLIGVDVR
jgi:hypothetical protein